MNKEELLNDRGIRIALIPLFGIVIPQITGLFGTVHPGTLTYWCGFFYFILLSFLIWHGNRYFLILQRRRFDWLDHPVQKVIWLLLANVFYTTPLCLVMLAGWFYLAGFPDPDWAAIRLSTALCVICVLFISHVYETVYLIQQRESDLLTLEKLRRTRVQAQLEALKNQIAPHFLFNSLNTLSHLIATDPRKAAAFTDHLARVYRYILYNRNRELVLLKDELSFLYDYYSLIRLRFGDSVRLETPGDSLLESYLIPPISLQLLLENAVKHNEFSAMFPLIVEFDLQEDYLEIRNYIRKKQAQSDSPGMGLENLNERYRLIVQKGIQTLEQDHTFKVQLPLLRLDKTAA